MFSLPTGAGGQDGPKHDKGLGLRAPYQHRDRISKGWQQLGHAKHKRHVKSAACAPVCQVIVHISVAAAQQLHSQKALLRPGFGEYMHQALPSAKCKGRTGRAAGQGTCAIPCPACCGTARHETNTNMHRPKLKRCRDAHTAFKIPSTCLSNSKCWAGRRHPFHSKFFGWAGKWPTGRSHQPEHTCNMAECLKHSSMIQQH